MPDTLLIILIALVFSAFFSGLEIAFISSNRLHIELENKKGNFSYRLLSGLIKRPARFIGAMLVGNNIALVVYGIFMPEILVPITGWIGSEFMLLLVQTLLATAVILVVAEFLPKTVFNNHANQALKIFSLPAYFFYYLFFPVVSFIIGVSNGILKRFFKISEPNVEPVFDKVDLDDYIRENTESRGEDDMDTEVQIFKNALDFSNYKAREFMVPRTEVVALDTGESLENLRKAFVESGLSKILIYENSIDNITGYVHSFELFRKPSSIGEILRPISFIPESMTANEILSLMLREKQTIAVVLDEFGGTSGLVTIEDVVEELFGEIDDEHDTEELTEKRLSENEYLLSARHEIDYLNERYRLDLPESENYNTLGGYILNNQESIPGKDETIRIDKFVFTILEVSNNRIEEVRVKAVRD